MLFDPRYLGCPVCNELANSHGGTSIGGHKRIGPQEFVGHGCGHTFTLYDALKRDLLGGTFGILNVFAHWSWYQDVPVEAGKLASIPLPMPAGYRPFAANVGQYAPPGSPDIHVIPRVLALKPDALLLSVPGGLRSDTQMLGVNITLTVSVYGYRENVGLGWRQLFYESLTDFIEQRGSLSIFKLATSIEIYADVVYEAYLKERGLTEADRRRILRARDWETRAGRVKDLCEALLDAPSAERYGSSMAGFRSAVRGPRNAFAHDAVQPVTAKENKEAYRAAFDVLWVLSELEGKLI